MNILVSEDYLQNMHFWRDIAVQNTHSDVLKPLFRGCMCKNESQASEQTYRLLPVERIVELPKKGVRLSIRRFDQIQIEFDVRKDSRKHSVVSSVQEREK